MRLNLKTITLNFYGFIRTKYLKKYYTPCRICIYPNTFDLDFLDLMTSCIICINPNTLHVRSIDIISQSYGYNISVKSKSPTSSELVLMQFFHNLSDPSYLHQIHWYWCKFYIVNTIFPWGVHSSISQWTLSISSH